MRDVPDLTDAQVQTLNRKLYEMEPWIFFQQRLAHLMLAADQDRYRAIFQEGVSAGGVTLRIESSRDEPPTPEQSIVAIESEVLLHHSSETLLRFVHAHAGPSASPWVRMASLTSHKKFKSWVAAAILDAPDEDLLRLCEETFAVESSRADGLDACASYLRLLGTHFVDADSYNAAKYGMGLRGGNHRLGLEIDGWRVLDCDGVTVDWLACWPRDDPEQAPRWTQVSRFLDQDATIALIYTATMLMRSIWIRGRARHLSEPLEKVYRPTPPDDLFASRGLRHHVIADVYEPFPADGETPHLHFVSANLRAPPETEENARPDKPTMD
ncbi:MAG: hypothetical protein WBD55_11040 [Dehalococcoidia bacterium]